MRFEELLPVEPRAPMLGRRVLHRYLAGRLPRDRIDDAKLAASELITRAVLHAEQQHPAWIAMTVDLNEGRIRIEVRDEWYRQQDTKRAQEATRWSLLIVEQLASRWGVDPGPPTLVWFEIDAV